MAAVAKLLDRLNASNSAGIAFVKLWQKNCESLEAAISDLSDQLAAITAAQAAADAAAASALAAAREMARLTSYTAPTNVLTAADVGSDCTITVAAHTRIYPVQGAIDVPDVSILAGSVTGLAFSTLYYVYYDDTTLADTTPTYVATTNIATAQAGVAAGRHFVGEVTTPADGGGGTSGTGGGRPPGYGGGGAIP